MYSQLVRAFLSIGNELLRESTTTAAAAAVCIIQNTILIIHYREKFKSVSPLRLILMYIREYSRFCSNREMYYHERDNVNEK